MHRGAAWALCSENSVQQLVGHAAAIAVIVCEPAPVVLGECPSVEIERLDADLVAHRRALTAPTCDQFFDGVEFVECRPVRIAAPPIGLRLQPDGKCLGEVFGRMGLRVPLTEVVHIAAATGTGAVGGGGLQKSGGEGLAPPLAASQPISVVHGMASLVPQNAHEPAVITALYFAHDATLEPL